MHIVMYSRNLISYPPNHFTASMNLVVCTKKKLQGVQDEGNQSVAAAFMGGGGGGGGWLLKFEHAFNCWKTSERSSPLPALQNNTHNYTSAPPSAWMNVLCIHPSRALGDGS